MAKFNNVQVILDNPDSTFFGVYFTLRKGKLPRVFFVLKGSDLVPMTEGMNLFESKNYKKIIEKLKVDNQRLKNEKDDLVEELATIANSEYRGVDGNVIVSEAQKELREVLDDHGVDWDYNDEENDYEEDEE